MSTSISICSNALISLGAQPISSFEDGSDRCTLAANLYASTRDAVLRSHPWNCATKRVVLAPDSAAPAFDYSAAFSLPSDCLRVLQVGEMQEGVEYRVEAGKILAGGTVLNLKYIFRNDNEATWDPMLIEAMELTMAAKMAYAITMSAAKEELAAKKAEIFMKRCRATDGQEDPAQQLGDERLLTARFGSFYVPGR